MCILNVGTYLFVCGFFFGGGDGGGEHGFADKHMT